MHHVTLEFDASHPEGRANAATCAATGHSSACFTIESRGRGKRILPEGWGQYSLLHADCLGRYARAV